MPQKIGVQAVLETADFLKGVADYMNGMQKATGATESFAATAQGPASAGLNMFQEVVTGALRKVGEVAVDSMGRAIGAIGDFVSASLAAAAEEETGQTRLKAVITAMGDEAALSADEALALAMANRDLFKGTHETAESVLQVGMSMGTVSRDEMPTFLKQVADLAAVTGTDAPSAARLMARAYEDPIGTLRAFRTQNIMVDAQTKKTIANLVKQGKTEEAAAILLDRVGKSTAGAAETMANTTEGRLAIMRAHIGEIGESMGSSILGAFLPLATEMQPAIDGIESAVSELFQNADFQTAIADLGPLLRDAFGNLGKWLRSPEVQQGLSNLVLGIANVERWIVGGEWKNNPLFGFLKFLGDWWAVHGPAISAVAGSVFGVIQTAVKQLADQIGPFITEVLGKLQTWFTDNGPLIAQFAAILMTDFGTLVTILLGAWTVIQPILSGLIDLILNVGKIMMQVAVGDWAGAWETMKAAGTSVNLAIQAALMAFADWIASWFGTTWQGIKDQWAANWELFKIIVATVWDSIVVAVGEKALAVVTAVATFLNNVKATIEGKIEEMKAAGKALIVGLWEGIRDRLGQLKTDVSNAIASIVARLKKVLGIGSPSKLFYEFGVDVMQGLSQGIAGATAAAAAQMRISAAQVAAPALAGNTYSSSRTTNYNMDFNANYARTQSPVTVRDDVLAILAQTRR